jgi:hypothetical protein
MDAGPHASDAEPFPDAAVMQAELGARVAARRAAGEYPPGLDDALEQHAAHLASRPPEARVRAVADALQRWDAVGPYERPDPAASSRIPGGTRLHALISSNVARHTGELVNELEEHARAEREVLERILDALGDLAVENARLREHVQVLHEEQASLRSRLAALEHRDG